MLDRRTHALQLGGKVLLVLGIPEVTPAGQAAELSLRKDQVAVKGD